MGAREGGGGLHGCLAFGMYWIKVLFLLWMMVGVHGWVVKEGASVGWSLAGRYAGWKICWLARCADSEMAEGVVEHASKLLACYDGSGGVACGFANVYSKMNIKRHNFVSVT